MNGAFPSLPSSKQLGWLTTLSLSQEHLTTSWHTGKQGHTAAHIQGTRHSTFLLLFYVYEWPAGVCAVHHMSVVTGFPGTVVTGGGELPRATWLFLFCMALAVPELTL